MSKKTSLSTPKTFVLLLLIGLLTLLPVSMTRAAPAATITVTNTNDSGNGSLRWAIEQANSNAGADTIEFNVSGTITLVSELPPITDDYTVIDASSQWSGTWPDGSPGIILDGTNLDYTRKGISIYANHCQIRGLFIKNFSKSDNIGIYVTGDHNVIGGTGTGMRNVVSGNKYGIKIYQASYNEIAGNYIGVDADGVTDLGNDQYGINILNASYHNVIGGTTEAARNVISGNDVDGISISGSNNTVQGNYIGTDKNGTAAVPNAGDGIVVYGHDITIGGTDSGAGNVISGNGDDGVSFYGGDNNELLGNYIGTDKNGTADLGNASAGVYLWNGAQNNTVGGTASGAGNIISGNDGNGVYIDGSGTTGNQVLGNYIGTDKNGTADLGNSQAGVFISDGAQNNTVGGTSAASRNIISGNNHTGVYITGSGTDNNTVSGNYIGTDLNGTADLGNTYHGVWILGGAQSNTIGGTSDGARNVISGNDASGVAISGTGTNNNVVEGNYIGTTADGVSDRGNTERGVIIDGGAQSNIIGGSSSAARNIISGNGYSGVTLENANTSNNEVKGNYIGINVEGNYRRNDSHGVYILDGANNNTIGGSSEGDRNVISCNGQSGVRVGSSGSASVSGTIIRGNYIGTDPTGEAAKGNSYNGIYLQAGNSGTEVVDNLVSGNGDSGIDIQAGTNTIKGNIIGADKDKQTGIGNNSEGILVDSDGNTIGGTASGEGNFIAWNGSEGIEITKNNNTVYGNTICNNDDDGIDIRGYGEHADNNVIGGTGSGQANTIYGNGGNGVYVYGVNESGGYDFRYTDYNKISGNSIYDNTNKGIALAGSGNGPGTDPSISAPAITAASLSGTTLHVEGNGAGANASLEFFEADDGTSGEGKVYLGNLTADGSGNFSGDIDVSGKNITAGDNLVATTTHTDNNTSEFSGVKVVSETGTIISAQTGNWEDASTWEGGVVPTSADKVVVYEGHTVTVNDARECNSLSLKPNSVLLVNATLPTASGYDFDVSSLVNYGKSGDQTVSSTPSYGKLTTSGSGTKTADGNLQVTGDFTISGSSSFTTNGTVEVDGNTTVENDAQAAFSGAVTLNGALSLTDNATAQNNAQLTVGGNFSLSGNSVFTQGGDIDANGNITIGSGTTFNGGSQNINIAGDWSDNGTWNYSTGTVIFDEPSSEQTIGPASSGGEVQVGTGDYDLYKYPFYNFYENNKTQMLYLSSEIGQAGTITGIQFNLNQVSPEGYRDFANFTVKLKETTESNWSNKGSYADMTGATVVFSQNPYSMPGSTGWFTISFDTPFNYSGSNNLIVEIVWGDNGAYASDEYQLWATDLGDGNERVLYGYADSETPPDFDDEDDELPNIKFNFQGSGARNFYNLTISTAGSPGTTTSQADMHIHNNLVVNSGSELVMGENELTVDGTLTNNGYLRRTRDVNGSADVTFFDTGGYGGLTINANGSDLGSTNVRISGNQDCTANAGETVRRCFEIQPTTTSNLNAAITFYFAAGELSANDCTNLVAYHWNGSSWDALTTGNRSCTTEPYSVQATGVTDFSPFVLKSGNSPTAVTLRDFRTRPGTQGAWLPGAAAFAVVLILAGCSFRRLSARKRL